MKSKTQTETFSVLKVAEMMNCARETVRKKFRRIGIEPTTGRRYSMAEIVQAFETTRTVVRGEGSADPFRDYAQRGALCAFFDGWANMEESLIEIANTAGATGAKMDRLACCWFSMLALRMAAFLMNHADSAFDFKGQAAEFSNSYNTQPPDEITIRVPPWIQAAAKRIKFVPLLEETIELDRSALLPGDEPEVDL